MLAETGPEKSPPVDRTEKITLAWGISREIRYKNVLGLNVLMIRI